MLIVEDGTGVSGSNSYISVDDADTYHLLYNNVDWVGEDVDKENALILATRSIDLLYGPRYLSEKHINAVGSLLFPRMSFMDWNGQLIEGEIPSYLRDAVCEVALMSILGQNILPTKNTDGLIKNNKIKIGEIEIQNEYQGSKELVETYSSFNTIDLLLYPILKRKRTSLSFHL